MSVVELLRRQPRPQIVDVRSPDEYATGHVPGAINIPVDQVEARVADIDAASEVVLVCQSGSRALIAARRLAHDRPGIQILEGGTGAWVGSGLCTVASAGTRWSLERQVRLGAGILVLAGIVMSMTVNPAWVYLSAFVGLGLTFAGLTNICGMAVLLAKLPWNRPSGRME